MMQGTFREWVDNNTPGIFTVTDDIGITTRIQLAEYKRGQITYDVFLGYHGDDGLIAREYNIKDIQEVAIVFLGSWDVVGEVTDG